MPAIFAGIGAGASIIGGFMGMSSAKRSNAQAKKHYKEQKKLAKKSAKIANKYNLESYRAEKTDYYAARAFQYEMAIKQWKYDTEVQDFRYLQDMRAYRKSVENYGQQLFFNNISDITAQESQMAAFNEVLDSATFEKQSLLGDQLEEAGQAQMAQAGVSGGRAMAISAAKHGRDLAVLRASLKSSRDELTRNQMDLALQRFGADMQARSNLMLRPERLPELIKPEMAPERTFVAPAKVLPGAVSPPRTVNPYLPLVQSISSAATSFAPYADS